MDTNQLWARLHVRTGLSYAEFETLDLDTIEALLEALTEEEERQSYIRATLFAVIANTMGAKCEPADFLPAGNELKDDLAEAKLSARAASIGKSPESSESDESRGADDETVL